MELEKVNLLCKEFCDRYISCLKGKLQNDNLLQPNCIAEGNLDGLQETEIANTSHSSNSNISPNNNSKAQNETENLPFDMQNSTVGDHNKTSSSSINHQLAPVTVH